MKDLVRFTPSSALMRWMIFVCLPLSLSLSVSLCLSLSLSLSATSTLHRPILFKIMIKQEIQDSIEKMGKPILRDRARKEDPKFVSVRDE